MPDGKVILVLTLVAILAIGTNKAVHGIVKGGKAVGHAVVHVVHHQRKQKS